LSHEREPALGKIAALAPFEIPGWLEQGMGVAGFSDFI
jgi:hypothetical protein